MQRLQRVMEHLDAPNGASNAPTSSLKPQPVTSPPSSFPPCKADFFSFDDFLTPEERAVRYRVREFAERDVFAVAADAWDKSEFPFHLVEKLRELRVFGGGLAEYGAPRELSHMANVAILLEFARVDTSISTFWLVHNCLGTASISLCASEQQKRKYLPDMIQLKKISSFALTEPERGSDASSLETTARRTEGGWILNGKKRWIGNATFADIIIVWAAEETTRKVLGFIVSKDNPGYSASKILYKMSLRTVQNADITLTNCFVPEEDRLPLATDFASGPGRALTVSRVMVSWQPVGMAMGIFDHCIDYIQRRQQFHAPLASFQLIQEKLSRMLGTIQAMMMMAYRLSQLSQAGKMTAGQAALTKAHNSLRGREVAALGREIMGGNGILTNYHVGRLFCDMESIYTYEGTYEINSLVAAREATGVAAFKSSHKQ